MNTKSGWMFVVWLLVWIVALGISALLLAISFPVLRLWVALFATVLLPAFPGFAAGLEWDKQSFTAAAKSHFRGVFFAIPVLVVMTAALSDALKEHNADSIWLGLAVSGGMTAGTLAAFYLGRRIARRRAQREHT